MHPALGMRKVTRKLVGWAVAAVINMTTLQAAAAEESDTRWYGWQTLAVDAAAAATMVVGVATAPNTAEGAGSLVLPSRALEDAPKSTTTLDVGLALYSLGPAVVHAAHGRPLHSMGSAAMRGLGPTAGACIGFAIGVVIAIPVLMVSDDSHGGFMDFGKNGNAVIVGGIVSGAVLGAAVPVFVDATVFSKERVETKEAPKTPPPVVTVQPQLSYTKAGPSVGVAGTF